MGELAWRVPLAEDEQQRLEALKRYGVVGTPAEQVYDDLTLLAAHLLNAPFADLSFVGDDRLWIKSQYGPFVPHPMREDSFCAHVILNQMDPTVVSDAHEDERFRHLSTVEGFPHFRSCAGAALITPDFHAIGALCVMDTEPRTFTPDQLELLRTMARQAVSQLELRRQTFLLSAANEKLQTLATCDSLTGLKNFRAFQEHLDDELTFASRNHVAISLILLDVDNFKDYNDRYGHPAGDEALQAVSILLLESSRDYDLVARYGGEEFAIVLRGADSSEAFAVAERLRSMIEGANWPYQRVTASLGIATYSPKLRTRDAMVAEADRLLYRSKMTGKNRVSRNDTDDIFDPAMWDIATKARQQNPRRKRQAVC